MSKETDKPETKKHHKHVFSGKHHKDTHKHHTVKPHPLGEWYGHQVVNNATGQVVARFEDEDAAHEHAARLEPDVTVPGPEEPIQ